MLKRLSLAALLITTPTWAFSPSETPMFADQVKSGDMPPVAERAPAEPYVVDLESRDRKIGKQGGTLRTLISKGKNIRYMVVWGYARLIGFDENYELKADILESFEQENDRVFTLRLRKGHKWSDGHPFTTEDFRYWWEDVANNSELAPAGPPRYMLANEKPPKVDIIDEQTIRFTWEDANPQFLTLLAGARPPFIYRPSHYMKHYHINYTDQKTLDPLIEDKGARNWAQLHNKLDNMYKNDNEKLPTLQPWINKTGKKAQRYEMQRNPYFHRFDKAGQQLPYIDTVEMTVSAASLFPAKVSTGEVDLLAAGLGFPSIAILKQGEERNDYQARLWPTGAASHIALYPNLNYHDEGWREVLRDARFRQALSMAVDRNIINQTLYFGMGAQFGNGVLHDSPFFDESRSNAYAMFDIDKANKLLDQMGLTKKRGDGVRLLPDGRPAEIIIETMGERGEEIDALQLIGETWSEIGVKLIARPSDRNILRQRAYAGQTMMTVGKGWDNGVPTSTTAPLALAPTEQDNLIWPQWGQHFQTSGQSGSSPDLKEAQRLLELYLAWQSGTLPDGSEISRKDIWEEMLDIHAEQQYIIGVVSQAPQPVVVSNRLENVPTKGLYTWDPGAHFGVHRMDEFWFDGTRKTAKLK